jgi:hypothetical protein
LVAPVNFGARLPERRRSNASLMAAVVMVPFASRRIAPAALVGIFTNDQR